MAEKKGRRRETIAIAVDERKQEKDQTNFCPLFLFFQTFRLPLLPLVVVVELVCYYILVSRGQECRFQPR